MHCPDSQMWQVIYRLRELMNITENSMPKSFFIIWNLLSKGTHARIMQIYGLQEKKNFPSCVPLQTGEAFISLTFSFLSFPSK